MNDTYVLIRDIGDFQAPGRFLGPLRFLPGANALAAV